MSFVWKGQLAYAELEVELAELSKTGTVKGAFAVQGKLSSSALLAHHNDYVDLLLNKRARDARQQVAFVTIAAPYYMFTPHTSTARV